MPIKIPKNRKVIKSIKMKNGTLTGEVDDQGKMYWFKNGKYIEPHKQLEYKYYDPSIDSYRTLDSRAKMAVGKGNIEFDRVNTPVHTPFYNKLLIDSSSKRRNFLEKADKQNIPLANQKWITLRTKGKMNLADVPVNMLDSIAVNAGRSGVDFYTAMGLVGKESTFGGVSKSLGRPSDIMYKDNMIVNNLVNNHSYFTNPEEDYLKAIGRKHGYNVTDKKKVEIEKDIKYNVEKGLKERTPHYSDYVLADAFKRYESNPAKYNPGQANYVPMVNVIRQELAGEKQLQEYWNSRGKQEYERGKKEGMKNGGRVYLDEARVPYKGGGIYIKPSKRGTFTAAASKHGMGVQEFAARVLRNKENYSPSLVKKANFARNASKWNH